MLKMYMADVVDRGEQEAGKIAQKDQLIPRFGAKSFVIFTKAGLVGFGFRGSNRGGCSDR